MKNTGTLFLIPTPIDETSPLEQTAFDMLLKASADGSVITIEDLKPGRRRWLRWGLPREQVDKFVLYNEHSWKDECEGLIQKLQKGINVYLMSDGGLPAYCDPGRQLVEKCHQQKIKVSASPFPHSIALALAMSGFEIIPYQFLGFPPAKTEERLEFLKEVFKNKTLTVLMDTPYRLEKFIEQLKNVSSELGIKKDIFLAMDLNQETESYYYGPLSKCKSQGLGKREFILILK
ncbi:hypothetical protein OAT67_06155 [Bacteriovoracaceae bacterium]|nr:hypothetical protein [Bacteriovoracaceae bacterium]